MALQATPGAKKFLRLLAVLLIVGGGIYFAKSKGLLDRIFKKSVVVANIDLPTAPKNSTTSGLTFAGLPSTNVTSKALPKVTLDVMAWSAQMAVMFANGGKTTTEGSLMEKHGVKLTIKRQDDINQASQELIKFAKAYKDNPTTAEGTNFFAMMGDGSPATLASLNAELEKLGPEYRAQVVFSLGRSDGEDALMAPVSWRENPQNAKGGVCVTVIRDGDWNIVIKWAADNNIKVNPDEKTYDPDAINFINASDFTKSAEMYVSGNYTETRPVVKDGKTTGEKKVITPNAVSTWTPADVTVAEKRGGLVRIVSTHEYSSQMPNVVIGIKKWMEDNRTTVENFIKASVAGGDQVKSYSAALDKAGEVSAQVYNEQTGTYWVKYAKGVTQSDKQGLQVQLGGSAFFNLADNLNYYGLSPNSTNVYNIIYKTFSKIDQDLYPELFKSFPDVADVLDLSYLRNVAASITTPLSSATTETYSKAEMSQIVAKRSWSIEFALGSANLTQEGKETVDEIYDALIVANGLKVEVDGHTDNTGSEPFNISLSEERANAVKAYLQAKSSANFPDERVIVKGFGSSQPIADNGTKAGQAKNRRVSIIMGK